MLSQLRRRFVTSVIVLCGAVVTAQELPPAPTFRSRIDAIEIEMRVVDENGGPVVDLDPAEVEVFEDGRRQQIIAFSRVSVPIAPAADHVPRLAASAPPDVASNRVAASSRIFVLILDDLHVDRRNTHQVKSAARRFVERYVQPGDLVSVVYTGVRPEAAQDFTSDRGLLIAAIDKFIGRKLPPATVERMEQYNMLFRARGRPRFEDLRDRQDGERAFSARAAMASIEAASTVLGRVTGRRKAAIIFSEGFDYDLAGLRSRGRSPGAADGPTVLPNTVPTGGSEADAAGRVDVHSYANDVLVSLQAAIGAASRANVALYSMDVRGDASDSLADLGAPVDDPSLGLTAHHVTQEMRDAQETLSVIAANTGGFAALSPSEYDDAFARIVRESSEYYLVAYSPWNVLPDGTYRDITVHVKRPDVRVSARRGYYAPSRPVQRTFRFVAPGISEETSAIVMAPVPAAGLSLDVHTVAFKHDKKTADVVVTANLDGRQLTGNSAAADVVNTLEQALIAIDSTGRVHAATGRAIDIRLDAAASRLLRDSGYRVISRVQLPPGRYQIRQAVRERRGGRQGSVFADIEVPDFSKRLTTSGIVLTSTRVNAVPTSIDPETFELFSVLPSVRRGFRSDDELIVMAEIYDASRGRQVDVITTVSDASGSEQYRRLTTVEAGEFRRAGGTYRHAVQIPLKGMLGDLLLNIEARPAGSPREAATRRVPFTVTPLSRP